jgi:uncharacterized membrane protein YphA (DoxX/SURF4 family)
MSHSPAQLVLTLTRLVVGTTAMLYGIAATFGIWGGSRLGNTSALPAGATALDPGTVETILANLLMLFGLVINLGLLTRSLALCLAALVLWHGIANGRFGAFFVQDGGCEHILFGVVACLVVATHGPGAYVVKLRGAKSGAKG